MSQIVKCEICGGVYNRRHLRSHQRLSHSMKKGPVASVARHQGVVDEILLLYRRLPNRDRKIVINLLTAAETNP